MRHTTQTGFSLIELMIGMAIVAILAAVALPAYENYIMRARVTELILAASSGRTCVAEAVTNNGTPSVPSSVSTNCTITKTPNISTAEVDSNGKIKIIGFDSAPASGGGCAQQTGPGITIELTPTVAASKEVTWACSGSPSKYVPSSCH